MHYIIFEKYEEYNQFEGRWMVTFNKFKKLEDAKIARRLYKKNHNIRNVSPILVNVAKK